MGIFSGLISLFSGGFIGEVGKAIDDNVTSDEERGKLRNELALIEERVMKNAQNFAATIENNVTERHKADMQSDNKLAKNVRPVTLIVLTIFTLLYMLVPVFKDLSEQAATAYSGSLTALISLDMLVYGFYFGSRGAEKVAQKIAASFSKKQE